MAHIIQESEVVENVMYELCFFRKADNEICAGFECDEKGNLLCLELRPAAKENYEKKKVDSGLYSQIKKFVHRYREPAILKCDCGCEVLLDSAWANECDCGTEYNSSGQKLAPRSQWGEETGETFY